MALRRDGPGNAAAFGAVESLLVAGHVVEAAELVEVAILEGTLLGKSAARLRLRLSSALLISGQAAEALSYAEAVLAENGLDDEIYSAGQLKCGTVARRDQRHTRERGRRFVVDR